MPQRIRSKIKFKGDLQPQTLTITTASASLGNATRAKMYNGKIVIDVAGTSFTSASRGVTIGGIPFPIRIIDGRYFAKVPIAKYLRLYKGQYAGVGSIGEFVRQSITGLDIVSNILSTHPGTLRYAKGGQANAIITGSQICFAAALNDGTGLMVLDYEPYGE